MRTIKILLIFTLIIIIPAFAEETQFNINDTLLDNIRFEYDYDFGLAPNEKPYDAGSAGLEGVMVWTMNVADRTDGEVLCSTDLATGESRGYDFKAYPIENGMNDIGVYLAEERTDDILIWHMDLEGSCELVRRLSIAPIGLDQYHTILAYKNGYVYYLTLTEDKRIKLNRMGSDGKISTYSGSYYSGCISENGILASMEYTPTENGKEAVITLRAPDSEAQLTIPKYENITTGILCWQNEETLLYWEMTENSDDHQLFAYDIQSNEHYPVLKSDNKPLIIDKRLRYGTVYDDRFVILCDQLVSLDDSPCNEPILFDLCTGNYYRLVLPYNFVERAFCTLNTTQAQLIR